MTLYRQIAILVTIVFTILLFTILAVSFNIIKDSVQKELYENAQNSVSSLSLSISNTSTSEGNIETMINAIFDNGNYERITYKNADEQVQYERVLEEEQNNVPAWFGNLVEIKIPVAKATLSSNWKIIGVLEILNSKNTAYTQLYNMMTHMFLYLSISCVIFLIILYYVFHIILEPLLEIQKQATLVMKNEFVIQKNIPKTKEFKVVIKSINSMIKKFESIFKSANETLSKNKECLYMDSITSIYNRSYFILRANEFLSEENERGRGSAIIISMRKVDRLNQILGHNKTDIFIHDFAQYIKSLIGIYNDAIVCRLNGTEIIIMLPRVDMNNSTILAESVIKYMDNRLEELEFDKNEFGISLAISQYESPLNISELFGLIDYSLEQAKLLPFGEYYTLVNKGIAIGKDKWRQNIVNGLNNDTFEIIYRKVIDIESKQKIHNIVSFTLNVGEESYSYGTLIAPIADLGMIGDVYLHIIKKVLVSNDCKMDTPTIIQLSSLFLNNVNTYEKLKYLFIETRDKVKCKIIFEIPELFINKYHENSLLYIKLFKEYGFDFGINSFIANSEDYQYLKDLKPTFVKADKQYLLDVKQNITILKIILDSLGIELIATGVNDLDEVNKLQEKNIIIIAGMVVDNFD